MFYTREQLREKYINLPDDIKDALDSVELLNLIESVSQKFTLHIDQSGRLCNEIGLLLFGLTRPENFLKRIIKEVNLAPEAAGEITKELNEKIFFPIRTSLEKLNNGGVASYRPEQAPKVENFSPAGNTAGTNFPPTTPRPNPNNNAIIVGSTAPLSSINSEQAAQAGSTGSPQAKSGDQRMFDEKMSKLFRLPKEEVELGTSHPTGPVTPPAQPKTTDPYREIAN